MLQSVATELRRTDLTQPALDVEGPRVLQPDFFTARLEVILPDVRVALHRGWALVFPNPGQINLLDEIANG